MKRKRKRCWPFCFCPPDVMFVSRASKNSLFYVFDSLSNLDCGQWYKFSIWQNHPTKCWLTEKSLFFAWSLLCSFILLLNGWTPSPTYCDPQTWQTRRYTTLGVLQLMLQNIVYCVPVGLLWNTCACCNWIYIAYRTLERKHGNNNVFEYYIFVDVY